MSTENTSLPEPENQSFAELLSAFNRGQAAPEGESRQINGTVIAVTPEGTFVDIGFKTEGILAPSPETPSSPALKIGDRVLVSVKGRNPEGYYELTRQKVAQPKDWSAFEQAFAEKSTIAGTVTAAVKGGLSVDVGVRAFMPASRSGARDAAALEQLIGQEILCRIIKLDVASEDIVVDHRIVAEEQSASDRERRLGELKEGDIVTATVRTLMDYGAFLDLGSVDALLHIGDISWSRVEKPSDALTVGQELTVKVLTLDPAKRRIGVGLKQLQPHPWDSVADRFHAGDRITGAITRLTDFGAFVQLEPGIEGMVHVSEMSWAKKVRKPGDLVKVGEAVEAVILAINVPERRISLGLKQTLGDPWAGLATKHPIGSTIEGAITSFTKFGAFVQVAEGVEGMIHVSEISADKRIEHPQDVLRTGQSIAAQVIEIDRERRQLRLSMKRLIPTGLDEYLAEHKVGDIVTARVMTIDANTARIELGEGIQATCPVTASPAPPSPASPTSASPSLPSGANDQQETPKPTPKPTLDLSAFSSMLKTKWKTGATPRPTTPDHILIPGQIRTFRITTLDAARKQIEVAPTG